MASIGQPIDRVDGRLKVTGRAKYAAEFAVPGVVHAVLVQSTIGAGAITGFDIDAAQAMPGVLAIITPENAPKLAMKGGTQQTVRCAAAAGHERRIQRPAHRGGRRGYSGTGRTTRPRACACNTGATSRSRRWMRPSTRPITPKNFRNGERPPDSLRGNPDLSFQPGAAKVDATYVTPMEHHNPMEPHATIATMGWRSADGLDGDAGHLRRSDIAGRACSASSQRMFG